jgi:hypothetical protein
MNMTYIMSKKVQYCIYIHMYRSIYIYLYCIFPHTVVRYRTVLLKNRLTGIYVYEYIHRGAEGEAEPQFLFLRRTLLQYYQVECTYVVVLSRADIACAYFCFNAGVANSNAFGQEHIRDS